MVIGVITARGGSKRLPGKNMIDLGGEPLIAHTYRAAAASQCLERVFLSTDIPEAIELARSRYPRVETPFVRPTALCRDETSQVEVVDHLLAFVRANLGLQPKVIVLLQPTSPFRAHGEIDTAFESFGRNEAGALIRVTRVLHHPADYIYRTREAGHGQLRWLMRDPAWRQGQDFPEVFFNTGALYICRVSYFERERRFFDERSDLFVMNEASMLDIDTPFDLALARGLLAHNRGASKSKKRVFSHQMFEA